LIDVRELSRLTGLSVNTLYSWVSQGKIPFVKWGRLTKFDLQAIDEWIKENTIRQERFDSLPSQQR
jgi:excisionase family DNA binding protein